MSSSSNSVSPRMSSCSSASSSSSSSCSSSSGRSMSKLPLELWSKVVLDYSPDVNQTLGKLSMSCKNLRDIFREESIWLSLFRKRFSGWKGLALGGSSTGSASGFSSIPAGLRPQPGGDGTLQPWRERYLALHALERRFRLGSWDRRIKITESTAIRDIFISGNSICVALGNGEIVLLEGEQIVSRKMGSSPAVRCFVDESRHRDGPIIYSALQNGSIKVGDFELEKAHQSKVTSLGKVNCTNSTNTGGSILYSCSPGDGVVKLWDASRFGRGMDGTDNLMSFAHTGVHSVAVSPQNPNVIFSGGTDKVVNLWDARITGARRRMTTPVHSVLLDDWVLALEGSEEDAFRVRAADKAVNTLDLRLVSSQRQSSSADAGADSSTSDAADSSSAKGDCRVARVHEHKKLITQFHCEMRNTVTRRLVSCSLDGMVKISSLDPFNGENHATLGAEDNNSTKSRELGNSLETSSELGESSSSVPKSAKAGAKAGGATLFCSNDYVLSVDFDDTRLIVGGLNGSLDVYDFEGGRAKGKTGRFSMNRVCSKRTPSQRAPSEDPLEDRKSPFAPVDRKSPNAKRSRIESDSESEYDCTTKYAAPKSSSSSSSSSSTTAAENSSGIMSDIRISTMVDDSEEEEEETDPAERQQMYRVANSHHRSHLRRHYRSESD